MAATVLIADDDEAFRLLVRKVIEGTVQIVGEAATDEEAIRMSREFRPDVVLMDVDLPLVGGLTTTRTIKADLPGTRVILMTGHDEEAYLAATGKSGADAFLPKREVRSRAIAVLRDVAPDLLRPWNGRERRGRPVRRLSDWDGQERRKPKDSGDGPPPSMGGGDDIA